jgi:4-amino-4-deoxy-L-arabinose transferase-like glycosyltransferase
VTLPSIRVILLLALALRLIWIVLIPVDPVSDEVAYNAFATNIVEHGVYGFTPDEPGAFWAVGTAAIYAGVWAVFGVGSALGVVAVNLLSSMASVWLLYDLGRRWFTPAIGQCAALLLACWPMVIQYTTLMASEMHFVALLLAGLACWDRVGRSGRGLAFLLLAGLFLTAATYVRPVALLVPAALAVAAVLRQPRTSLEPALKAVVVTAMIFALVAPWSARNERVLGEPVFMSTNFWPTFWMGNSPGSRGEFVHFPPEVQTMTEIEREDYLRALALENLRADPAGFVIGVLSKAVRLHNRETVGVGWNANGVSALAGETGVTALKAVSTLYWYAVLALAFWGIFRLGRRDGAWHTLVSPPVWLWLYFTAIHAIIIVADRYHMPAIPMIALLASHALVRMPARPANSAG